MVVPLAGLLLLAHAEGRGPPGPGPNGLAVRPLPPYLSRPGGCQWLELWLGGWGWGVWGRGMAGADRR